MSLEPRVADAFTMRIIDGPIVETCWEGEASEADALAIREFAADAVASLGPERASLSLIDATKATGLSRRARRALDGVVRDRPWTHVAIVGVNFELRVLLELIISAVAILKLNPAETKFFDARPEAIAWLLGQASSPGE